MNYSDSVEFYRSSIQEISERVSELDKNISKLSLQRSVLKTILMDLAGKNIESNGIKPTEKKINKSITTMYILEYLNNTRKRQVKSCDIYQYLTGKIGVINNNTFRTHIMNMKSDGLISPGSKKGYWKSLKTNKNSSLSK